MIKRELIHDLKNHLKQPEITVLIGPRQVGKTTLLLELKKELDSKGEKTLFLNLDIEKDRLHFNSQEDLINKIRLEIGNDRGFVFIDEIQRLDNAGLFLKGISDANILHKIIVTGSGSLDLKSRIKESLTGRKRLFTLLPVTFREFVNFRTEYRYEGKFPDFCRIEKSLMVNLLKEYLIFGGYPRVITEAAIHEKRYILDEIFTSYVEKDLVYLLRIERPEIFSQLVRFLAAQTGRIINYSETASQLGINLATLKKYLWIGEKTFIIYTIRPFFKNKKKELSKSPVPYFYDPGFCNYSLRMISLERELSEMGFLFQNFIFNEVNYLVKQRGWLLHFWRTKNGSEVDMVIDTFRALIPVEIKLKRIKDIRITRAMRAFINRYEPPEAWIINLSFQGELAIGNTTVKFFPFYEIYSLL